MPEIAEVALASKLLERHLRHRVLSSITYPTEDAKIFLTPKTGLTCASFAAALQGRTVVAVGRRGKYFWLETDGDRHPLMHFGMTGWIRVRRAGRDEGKGGYVAMKEDARKRAPSGDDDDAADAIGDKFHGGSASDDAEWPPRFTRFSFHSAAAGPDLPAVDVAFTDARRFSAVRLLACKRTDILKTSPLVENGPDPVLETEALTPAFFAEATQRRKVPIKALLLDQRFLSGIGNWVADEVLFQARVHPEQYAPTLGREQVERVRDKVIEVCRVAVDAGADSHKFPANWLMRHRWNKGKKDANKLPSGEKIVHVTVGGRTSAVVPSVQKKTGPVAGDVDEEEADVEAEQQPAASKKGKAAAATTGSENASNDKEKSRKRPAPDPDGRAAKKDKQTSTKPAKQSTGRGTPARRSTRQSKA